MGRPSSFQKSIELNCMEEVPHPFQRFFYVEAFQSKGNTHAKHRWLIPRDGPKKKGNYLKLLNTSVGCACLSVFFWCCRYFRLDLAFFLIFKIDAFPWKTDRINENKSHFWHLQVSLVAYPLLLGKAVGTFQLPSLIPSPTNRRIYVYMLLALRDYILTCT